MDVRAGHKEGWVPKNWCFQTVVLEKILESPLDCKEIKPVNPKENQLWIFIGRTDAETEAPILWPPDLKSQLIGKDPDAGKDWGQEEKGATEDEMVEWHHQKNQKLVSHWLNLMWWAILVALDSESQGCCDSGVVFEFFVAVFPLVKGKNWSHWAETSLSALKQSILNFIKKACITFPRVYTHTHTHTHTELLTKYRLWLLFIIALFF